MKVLHLTASPFIGGPERQLLGLAPAIADYCRTIFASFAEKGKGRPFLEAARELGFEAIELKHNAPRYRAAVGEIAGLVTQLNPDVVCCHGYKADILGYLATRRTRTPVVAVCHGWTGSTWKVRLNEAVDRLVLRLMDALVCVSDAQAVKVRECGVPDWLIRVIRNAVDVKPFQTVDTSYRDKVLKFFASPPKYVIGAAGRLSPEKGFLQLVDAAENVIRQRNDVGFLIFGDGPQKKEIARRIGAGGLSGRVVLAGFVNDFDRWLPSVDVFALPSFTEGLPVVVLEAFAAKIPVVATAVGGTPEVVEDGRSGFLVPSGEAQVMAQRIIDLLMDTKKLHQMGRHGFERVQQEFTFATQAQEYRHLFEELCRSKPTHNSRERLPRCASRNSAESGALAGR